MAVAIVGVVVAIVAAAVSATLTYESAKTQAETTEKIAKFNAESAANQAISERNRAEFMANQQRQATRRLLARQRALYGTAGVEENFGSPLMVQADSAMQGELDAQIIKSGGQARASAFETQASIDRFRGQAARGIETAGAIQAGTTLLSGAATAYRLYQGANPPTATTNTWAVNLP